MATSPKPAVEMMPKQPDAGASPVGPQLLGEDHAGQRLLGGEEQAGDELERDERDQAPRHGGQAGGGGESRDADRATWCAGPTGRRAAGWRCSRGRRAG